MKTYNVGIIEGGSARNIVPDRVRIVMICHPRGGISSKLTIDSDWGARGGEEKYRDWVGIEDGWGVSM